ncbi:MAG: hypothetical protein JHC33_07675, partial [Ignisphaera sp.]|nr:hypothetical protein [Ignisphaera sp.]
MTQILTNPASNSIILTLNNTLSTDSNVISMDPGESVLYDSVAITNSLDPNYNIPLLADYVSSGALVLETLTANHQSELQLLQQDNLTIGLGSGVPEIINKAQNIITDNIQVFPVTDVRGTVLCIYYKSIQGMSISTDLGATQTLISNDNLVFPDEITSFAVQAYESNSGILKQVNRLFIGTLREGVKSYTPGVDTTYVNFDPDVNFGDAVLPLFKTCEKTINSLNTITLNEDNSVNTNIWTTTESIVYPNFCATFVLSITNNPVNSGCPIFVATRPRYTQTTVTTKVTYNHLGVVINTIPVSSTVEFEKVKVAFKYLHEKVYRNNELRYTISTLELPPLYYGTPGNYQSNRWLMLQEAGVAQSISPFIITKPTFPTHILDVITEYTAYGSLFITKDDINVNRMYKVTGVEDVISAISIVELALPIELQTTQIRNITHLVETGSTNYNIFITADATVWRYSSVGSAWSKFLSKNSLSKYLSTSVKDGNLYGVFGGSVSFAINRMTLTILPTSGAIALGQKLSCSGVAEGTVIESLVSGTMNAVGSVYGLSSSPGTLASRPFTSYVSYLKDLSSFVLVPKSGTINEYLGLLGTEIGLLFYSLKLVNNIFTTEMKSGRVILFGVAKAGISDIKTAITSKNTFAFICSYSSQIPRAYHSNVNCLQLINQNSELTKHVMYIKPDVESTSDSLYYVNEDSLTLNAIPTTEQLSYDPVLIDANHEYYLLSPRQTFKLHSISDSGDTTLLTALDTFLAHKYYYPVVTERIISSVNKLENDVMQLDEYRHPFRIHHVMSLNNNEAPIDPGVPTVVVRSLRVTLPLPIDDGHNNKNFIVCIRYDGKTILPTEITQSLIKQYINQYGNPDYTKDQWQTRLTFSEEFTGTIFTHPASASFT